MKWGQPQNRDKFFKECSFGLHAVAKGHQKSLDNDFSLERFSICGA